VTYDSQLIKNKQLQPQGASHPAAMLLISMSPADAFVALVNLINRTCLRSFYGDIHDEMEAYYRVFGTLLADYMPKVSLTGFFSLSSSELIDNIRYIATSSHTTSDHLSTSSHGSRQSTPRTWL
jgi:hypothetical protein